MDTDAWRDVAIALHHELATNGYNPNSRAVRAYNHARNGRHTQALATLGTSPVHEPITRTPFDPDNARTRAAHTAYPDTSRGPDTDN